MEFPKTTDNNRFTLKLVVDEISTSVENNSSLLRYSLYLIANTSYHFSDFSIGYAVYINGDRVAYFSRSDDTDGTSLGSYGTYPFFENYYQTITHNADGTKSVDLLFSIDMAAADYTPGPITGTNTMTLTTIPRASSVSCPDSKMGTPTNITIARNSSAFTHKLSYSFKGNTGSIVDNTANVTYSWTPPETLANLVTDAESADCTITCETFNGNTSLGTKPVTIRLSVPDSAKPTVTSGWVTLAHYSDNSVVSGWGVYVKGYSLAKATFDTAKITKSYSANIVSYKLSCAGMQDVTAAPYQTAKFSSAGSVDVLCYVKDTRGRFSDPTTITLSIFDYSAPTLTDKNLFRCNASGAASDTGGNIYAFAVVNYFSCGGKNSYSLKARYRETVGSYNYANDIALENNTVKIIGGNGLSYAVNYEAQIEVTDLLSTSTSPYTRPIPSADVAFNIKNGGNGARFGGYAETDNLLQVDWDLNVDGNIKKGGVNILNFVCGMVYPVGSIYLSVNSTNPGTLFGGTWVAWGTGKVPVGIDVVDSNFNPVEKTGGKAAHPLTAAELASHQHSFSANTSSDGTHTHTTPARLNSTSGGGLVAEGWSNRPTEANITGSSAGYHYHSVSGTTGPTGSGTAHPNLQPYIVCYMWKRTA